MENETEENMQDEMETSVSYIEVLGIIICIMSLGFLYDSAVKNTLVLTSHPTKPALHFTASVQGEFQTGTTEVPLQEAYPVPACAGVVTLHLEPCLNFASV